MQPERRSMLHEECLKPLAAAGVDVTFHDGCVGRDLPLDLHLLQHGGIQSVIRGGVEYTVDTTMWKDTWSHQELTVVEQRMASMDWFPLAWLSFPKDVMEAQTPGFVGGHISHAETWRNAYEAGVDWLMVLEDDATPSQQHGLTWLDVWNVMSSQISQLRDCGSDWDIIYVGRTPSYTPEGEEITPLLVPTGYCLRTHTYCLSRAGLRKLLGSLVATTITHRPQDEILGTLTLLSSGLYHPREDFDTMLRRLAPREPWRALAIRYNGLTSPLEDIEDTARAKSDTAPSSSDRASKTQPVESNTPLTFEIVD